MSSMRPKRFHDDQDHLRFIKQKLDLKSYNEMFKSLLHHFTSLKVPTINAKEYAGIYCCEIIRSYQILDSFVVLGLLEKLNQDGRRVIYLRTNVDWWEEIKAEKFNENGNDTNNKPIQ